MFDDSMVSLVFLFVMVCWLWGQFARANPNAANSAKKAATEKAFDVIGKWFK